MSCGTRSPGLVLADAGQALDHHLEFVTEQGDPGSRVQGQGQQDSTTESENAQNQIAARHQLRGQHEGTPEHEQDGNQDIQHIRRPPGDDRGAHAGEQSDQKAPGQSDAKQQPGKEIIHRDSPFGQGARRLALRFRFPTQMVVGSLKHTSAVVNRYSGPCER